MVSEYRRAAIHIKLVKVAKPSLFLWAGPGPHPSESGHRIYGARLSLGRVLNVGGIIKLTLCKDLLISFWNCML